MGETGKLILTVLGSSALFTFLGVLVTLYFTRRKTAAETRSIDADALAKHSEASHTDAESMQLYVAEIRSSIGQWKSAMSDWAECVKQKAEAEARWREETVERERIEKYAEGLRLQKVAADAEITRLNGELAEARKGA